RPELRPRARLLLARPRNHRAHGPDLCRLRDRSFAHPHPARRLAEELRFDDRLGDSDRSVLRARADGALFPAQRCAGRGCSSRTDSRRGHTSRRWTGPERRTTFDHAGLKARAPADSASRREPCGGGAARPSWRATPWLVYPASRTRHGAACKEFVKVVANTL